MKSNRALSGVPGGKILTLYHPRHREIRGLADDALEGQRGEPCRVEFDARARHVDDLAELRAVRVRVRADLIPGERPAGLRAAARIAEHAGKVADDDDDLVAQVLEVSELSQDHRVSEMKIGGGGIQPQLDLQRRAGAPRSLELLSELGLDDDVGGTAPDDLELLIDRGELRTAQSTGVVSHRFQKRNATQGCPAPPAYNVGSGFRDRPTDESSQAAVVAPALAAPLAHPGRRPDDARPHGRGRRRALGVHDPPAFSPFGHRARNAAAHPGYEDLRRQR